MSTIDSIKLRSAFGSFITGVTVVTCRDSQGNAVAMTANSFSSVSLDPPLCSWSIAKTARNFEAFQTCSHFTVHVLHSGQEHISRHFASKIDDKFSDVPHSIGRCNIPVLDDYSARFECETEYRYAGGDHVILVGRVMTFDYLDREPLIFFKGNYR